VTTIKCSGEGCTAVFETSESVSAKAIYSCKLHTRSTGMKVQFQRTQFDHEMRRAANPVGTGHIKNQGSDIVDSNDLGQEILRKRFENGE
jgi:hypothetical protein